MRLLIYSFFVALAIPIFTYSLDPKNPTDSCERFISAADKKHCLEKAASPKVDWYASSLCQKIDDDKVFLRCFDAIDSAQFDPKAVEACEGFASQDDSLKLKCLELVKNRQMGDCKSRKEFNSFENCMKSKAARLPASEKNFFQSK